MGCKIKVGERVGNRVERGERGDEAHAVSKDVVFRRGRHDGRVEKGAIDKVAGRALRAQAAWTIAWIVSVAAQSLY